MPKTTKKIRGERKEKKQVIEIHIYVHQAVPNIYPPFYPPNGGAGGTGTYQPPYTAIC
jgi:hypothetical protein